MQTGIELAHDLILPIDFMTKTAAILAQRRKGKTYTASVFAEELVRLGQPFVALDPTGAWWGLRAAADGVGPGLPVVILGGAHGDLPLERRGGRFVADLVLEHPGFYILDFSLFESKAAEREFATDFAERLYRRKMQSGLDFPLHLFVDEADMFVPQERDHGGGDTRMLGAFQAIVRRGGLHGLGTTLISQRPALVNKSVLTQLDMLILLRLVAGNDQDYIDKNYIKRAATAEQRAEMMGSLASLALGEAYVWEPGAEPALFVRVNVRARRTFNSSATPKAGERRIEPQHLADVDLDDVKKRMADAIERAEAEDPRLLRQRIAGLEDALRRRDATISDLEDSVAVATEPQVVAEPYIPAAVMTAVERLEDEIQERANDVLGVVAAWQAATQRHVTTIREAVDDHDREALHRAEDVLRVREPARGHDREGRDPRGLEDGRPAQRVVPAARRVDGGASVPRSQAAGRDDAAGRILKVVAQFPDGRTRAQAAMLAKVSPRKSTIRNALSKLRLAGFIVERGDIVEITPAGKAAAGSAEPLPTGQELIRYWQAEVGGSASRMLGVLDDVYPRMLEREDLGERAGVDPGKSTIRNALSALRTLGLITEEGNRVGLAEELRGA